MSIDYDVVFEDGHVEKIRHAACLAYLSRVRRQQAYTGNKGKVSSIRLYFYDFIKDWHEYLMSSPAIMPYIEAFGRSDDAYFYYEVTANVNPHHLMFILGAIRVPYYLWDSMDLWRKFTEKGVHPDVAFYFSTFLFLCGSDVLSRGDVHEYALQVERYASWEGLKRYVTGVAINKNIPPYFTKRNVLYSSHKTYSRDGEYPVQGWLNGYKETASRRAFQARFNKRHSSVVCSLEHLTSTLLEVQEHLDLRWVEH